MGFKQCRKNYEVLNMDKRTYLQTFRQMVITKKI